MNTKSILLIMAAILFVGSLYTTYFFVSAPTKEMVVDEQVDLVISEQAFLELYIPHQEAAVAAAQLLLEKGTRLRPLNDIAAEIVEDKTAESEYLKAQYQALSGVSYTPTGAYRSSLRMQAELDTAPRERAFLEDMIRHHDLSVQLLQKSLSLSMKVELVEFAQDGIASAQIEILSLREVLQLLPQD